MEINGKKVIVIGGASGMGRASAELLARARRQCCDSRSRGVRR